MQTLVSHDTQFHNYEMLKYKSSDNYVELKREELRANPNNYKIKDEDTHKSNWGILYSLSLADYRKAFCHLYFVL